MKSKTVVAPMVALVERVASSVASCRCARRSPRPKFLAALALLVGCWEAPPCRLGLGPEVSLTPDLPSFWHDDAAYTAGKLLIAYAAPLGEEGSSVVAGNFLDVTSQKLGPRFTISPPEIPAAGPQVYAAGDRFLVAWITSTGEGGRIERMSARWVSAGGVMGDLKELPIQPAKDVHLQVRPGKVVAFISIEEQNRTSPSASSSNPPTCKTMRLEMNEALALASPASLVTAYECDWLNRPVFFANGDETLMGIQRHFTPHTPRPYAMAVAELLVLRLDASGAPMGEPVVLAKDEITRSLTGPVFFSTPGGVAAAWKYSPAPFSAGVYAVSLRPDGRPAGSPRRLAGVGGVGAMAAPPDTVTVRGAPWMMLADREGSIIALNRAVSLAGPPAALTPLGEDPVLHSTGDEAYLLWRDGRHGRDELFLAPVRCGGAIPQVPELPRPARETASVPAPRLPPDPAFTCASFGVVEERVVPFTGGLPARDELWVLGTRYPQARSSGGNPPAPEEKEECLDRYQVPTAARLSVSRHLGTFPKDIDLLHAENGGLISYSNGLGLWVLRLARDGSTLGKPVLVSDPLTESASLLDMAQTSDGKGAGVFWSARDRYLGFRTVPFSEDGELSSVLQLERPLSTRRFRVSQAPDGFVAAWLQDGLKVARFVTRPQPHLEWVADLDPKIAEDFTASGKIQDVATARGQIYVVAQKNVHADGALILRYGMDGARLGVTELPLMRPFAARMSDKGVAVYSVDREASGEHPRRCLHRYDLETHEIDGAVCAPPSFASPRGQLFWSQGVLYSLSQDQDSVQYPSLLRRWGCVR